MMEQKRPFVGGNWKMNGSVKLAKQFACSLSIPASVEVVVFPPYPYLTSFLGATFGIGAQNVRDWREGEPRAQTGEVACDMLVDLQVPFVLVGHSERRQLFGETDAMVREKVLAAMEAKLSVVVCVGEPWAARERDNADEEAVGAKAHVLRQLEPIADILPPSAIIAYEPVWAIGTGKTATPQQAEEMHAFIKQTLVGRRAELRDVRVIYGGSVTPSTSSHLFKQPSIDGFLVGGASLKLADFEQIIQSTATK